MQIFPSEVMMVTLFLFRLSNNPCVILPNSECCLTRPNFHVECESCPARFCSDQCRREAWDAFHKTLCVGSKDPDEAHPFVRLMDTWRSLHFPPETTSAETVARILASIVQAQDPDAQTARCVGRGNDDFSTYIKLACMYVLSVCLS